MRTNSRSFLLAASLLVAPLATAAAQQNNPAGNLGSNGSATATPRTADKTSTTASPPSGAATNTTVPGATGKTIVPGSTSSQAGASAGTAEQKTGMGVSGGK